MNRCKWWLCGLGVLLAVFSPAMAQEKGPEGEKPKRTRGEGRERPGRPPSVERDLYSVMVKELKLTDEQKTKLQAILKEHKEKADAWNKENGEKLKELQSKLREARKAKNEEQAKALSQQIKPLQDAQKKLEVEKMAAATAILTPEQQKAWKAYQFYTEVVRRYARMRLNDEQDKQIRELCAAAQKEIDALEPKNKEGRKKIVDDLHTKIVAEVLTQEQRDRMRTRGQKRGEKERPGAAGERKRQEQ
jgi:Spy/CpxP family protein refolding chaperone